jgi:hypothetical protein
VAQLAAPRRSGGGAGAQGVVCGGTDGVTGNIIIWPIAIELLVESCTL